MTIDTPTIADLAALMVESEPMFNEMGFEATGNSWEHDRMMEWWTAVITQENHDIVIAREGRRLVGVSVAFYPARGLWHERNTQVCEMAHHAAPDLPTYQRCKIMIKMLESMEMKIAKRGPLFFKMSYSPKEGFEAWGNYLQRKGYVNPVIQLSKLITN